MMTIRKRLTSSTAICEQIDSLDNDLNTVINNRQSAVDDYNDTTSKDYKYRQLQMEKSLIYLDSIQELEYLAGIYANDDNKLIKLLKRGGTSVNLREYLTGYNGSLVGVPAYSDNVYVSELGWLFKNFYKWSASRSTTTHPNDEEMYSSGDVAEPTANPNFLLKESEIPLYLNGLLYKGGVVNNEGSKSLLREFTAIKGFIDSYVKNGQFDGGAGINWSNSNSYKILKFKSSTPPLTFVCNGKGTYSTNTVVVTKTENFSVSTGDGAPPYEYFEALAKRSLPNFKPYFTDVPQDAYVICKNAAGDYWQGGRIKWTQTSTGSGSYSSVTSTYRFSAVIEILTDNKNYYTRPATRTVTKYYTTKDENGKVVRKSREVSENYIETVYYDNVLYPYQPVTFDIFKQMLAVVTEPLINSYISPLYWTASYGNVPQDLNPLEVYGLLYDSCNPNSAGDLNKIITLRKTMDTFLTDFMPKRIAVLKETLKDTDYARELIQVVCTRMHKTTGTLFQWYNNVLTTDDLYNRWKKNIVVSKQYFKKIAVSRLKAEPNEELFTITNTNDGSKDTVVLTYEKYAATQGETEAERLTWQKNNPVNKLAQYIVYCELFSPYYKYCGLYPSFKVGDTVFVLDDVYPEKQTKITKVEIVKFPGDADTSSAENEITTNLIDVYKLTLADPISNVYKTDNNARVVKEF